MFGFFVGTACLIGLWVVARGGHGHGHGWRGRHGFGGRYVLRRVLERLDTTPGQEKVIRSALDELREEARDLRGEARATRGDLATALRADELDRDAIDRVFAKHDELLERLRASLLRSVEQVHGTLDDRQRRELADMLEAGAWGRACGGARL